MNKPIRTISIFCLLLFVALMVNATWLQYWKADSYDNDARNRRVIEAAYSQQRGAILVDHNDGVHRAGSVRNPWRRTMLQGELAAARDAESWGIVVGRSTSSPDPQRYRTPCRRLRFSTASTRPGFSRTAIL